MINNENIFNKQFLKDSLKLIDESLAALKIKRDAVTILIDEKNVEPASIGEATIKRVIGPRAKKKRKMKAQQGLTPYTDLATHISVLLKDRGNLSTREIRNIFKKDKNIIIGNNRPDVRIWSVCKNFLGLKQDSYRKWSLK